MAPPPNANAGSRTVRVSWTVLIVVTLISIFGVFGFQSWHVWKLRTYLTDFHHKQHQMKELSVAAGYLDEVLSMAVRMYVDTGEDSWLREHEQVEGQLTRILDQLSELGAGTNMESNLERLASINDQLLALEREALYWARQDLREEAAALLAGPEYALHQEAFIQTWKALGDILSQRISEGEQEFARKTHRTLLVFQLVLPLLVGVSVAIVLLALRWLRSRRQADALTSSDLVRTRSRFEAVVENMNDGLVVCSPVDDGEDFEITAFNAGSERIENRSRENAVGRRLTEVFPESETLGLLEVMRRVWQTALSELFVMPLYQAGQIEGWREFYIFRLPGDEVAWVCTDRTEERLALMEMERSERRYRTLYRRTPAMLHSIDADANMLAVSDYWLEVMGYERDEVIGKPLFNFLSTKSARFAKDVILPRFFALGKVEDVPYEMVTRDGRVIEVRLSAISERDEKNRIVRSLAVVVDVTAGNRAEAALKENEQRYRILYNKTPAMLHSIDRNAKILSVSDYWLEVLGYERDEVLGRTSYEFMTEETAKYSREVVVPDFFRTGFCTDIPYRMVAKDGRLVDVLLAATGERDETGAVVRSLSVLVDVTEKKKAEEALRKSEERLRNVALTSGDWIWQVDAQGRYVYTSESVERILGYTPEELYGASPFDFMTEGHVEWVREQFKNLLAERRPIVDLENWNQTKYGRRLCLLTNGVPIYDGEGNFAGYFGVDKDITRRKNMDYQLQLFGKFFDTALEGIVITDPDARITEVNQAFTDITGYSRQEVMGRNPRMLKSDRHDEAFYQDMWQEIEENGFWEGELWNRRKDGEAYPQWLSISALKDEDGYVSHYVGVFHDITEIKSKEEQIRFQANHDALTGLPNRNLFLDRLDMALGRAKRNKNKVAVVYVDLDNFKTVNDSLGHTVGDELLLLVADRFRKLVRDGGTLARLGGDEFAFLVDSLADESESAHMALQVIESMELPLAAAGRELYISPSIGIAIYPSDGQDPMSLLKHADLAMYQAKEQGRNQYHLFTNELNMRARRRLDLEGDLRRAIAGGDLFLVYQPKVDVQTLRVRGMEALVRWRRGDEVVPPDEFISLAEETGLIIPLGLYVLNLACKQCRGLLQDADQGVRVSVNLSARQFRMEDLYGTVERVLKENGLPAERLELEITESVLAGDLEETVARIARLRGMGLSVSVDDFGTGYSSLAYLKHFPISTLKVDRAFVMGLGKDEGDENIVKTVIQLAQNFGLTVVAEGVEDAGQFKLLKELGCDQIQGYLFSKPLEYEELVEFLKKCDPCKKPK